MSSLFDHSNLCFHIEEYKLQAIKNEIVRRGEADLKGSSYNADGSYTTCIRDSTIELSILEVSGHFGRSNIAKATQDHVKGAFGVQEIANMPGFGSLEIFPKNKNFLYTRPR